MKGFKDFLNEEMEDRFLKAAARAVNKQLKSKKTKVTEKNIENLVTRMPIYDHMKDGDMERLVGFVMELNESYSLNEAKSSSKIAKDIVDLLSTKRDGEVVYVTFKKEPGKLIGVYRNYDRRSESNYSYNIKDYSPSSRGTWIEGSYGWAETLKDIEEKFSWYDKKGKPQIDKVTDKQPPLQALKITKEDYGENGDTMEASYGKTKYKYETKPTGAYKYNDFYKESGEEMQATVYKDNKKVKSWKFIELGYSSAEGSAKEAIMSVITNPE
jgi:hypothetical protein